MCIYKTSTRTLHDLRKGLEQTSIKKLSSKGQVLYAPYSTPSFAVHLTPYTLIPFYTLLSTTSFPMH